MFSYMLVLDTEFQKHSLAISVFYESYLLHTVQVNYLGEVHTVLGST